MGLSASKRKQVEKLLGEGKSQRAIQRETGVSRVSIAKIEHSLLFPEKADPPPPPPRRKKDDPLVYICCKSCKRKVLEHTACIYCIATKKQLESYDTYMNALLTPGG